MTGTEEKKKHILVVSQYFYPEPFRINDMCQEWVKRGYKVTVLTGIPNYPEGKFYKGYGWCKKRKETWNGIDIIRIPIVSRGKGKIRLVLNYYSFVISGWFWKLFTSLKADVIFTFEVSPMTQALVPMWFAKKRKIPHYLYVQDLWPENVQTVTGINNGFILKRIGKMVDKIYRRCDLIFGTSESFVNEIQKRVYENKDKVKYWPQYAEGFYQPTENTKADELPNGVFKIIFTGNIGKAQGLDILPKTAAVLKERDAKVNFVIVGDGREKEQLLNEIAGCGVEEYFTLIPRKSAEEIPGYLCACDMAFVSYMDNPLWANTIPAKMQSYMACGMPILASASGETEKIIREADCGVCCEIGNEKALADAICTLMERNDIAELGKNAKAYSDKHFDKTTLMDEMDTYLER